MPKDKDTSIRGFAITAEDEAKMRDMATAADYSAKESSEIKAEPQDESEIICYYFTRENDCPGAMGDERHYVIKNGKMVMAHKQCHAKSQEENTNLRIIIKGGSSCRGGTCRR